MLKNVLIVEDQQLVRAGMKAMLHLAEPQCRIAESGNYEDSIAQLRDTDFDVVFLDIDLRSPRSGMDVLAHIRERDLRAKVIMLSATDDRDTVLDCIAAGASGYIAKGMGDESVFQRALATVFADGVFLPASIIGAGGPPRASSGLREARSASELGLSARLCEVLYYVCQGLPNKAIANRMGISEGTVRKNYVSELLRFFNVARRTALVIEVSRRDVRVPAPAPRHAPLPGARPAYPTSEGSS